MSRSADTNASGSSDIPGQPPNDADDNNPSSHPWWLVIALLAFMIVWPVTANLTGIDQGFTAYVLVLVLGAFGVKQFTRRR
jgi:hypothetical protein